MFCLFQFQFQLLLLHAQPQQNMCELLLRLYELLLPLPLLPHLYFTPPPPLLPSVFRKQKNLRQAATRAALSQLYHLSLIHI